MADPKAIFDDDDSDNIQPEKDLLDCQPSCLKCGQIQRMMKCCTKCHAAFYCSKTCFAKHWPEHKRSCQLHTSTPEQSRQHPGAGFGGGGRTLYRVIQHHKAPDSVPLAVNFQKAADALTSTPSHNTQNPQQSPDAATRPAKPPPSDPEIPGVDVTLRYNKQKRKFKVCDAWDPHTILAKISTSLSCLPDRMRLIHKGRQLSAETVRSCVSPSAVFQVLGEAMEDAGGLDTKDIEVLMRQMGVERNVAVRALRRCEGELINAMMDIGNK